ncbi:MAG TPA: hypothetical protein HPQ04_06315 [Rhodospirillaceae bacterium]|nr:hypothetical protein [Rhodospirillaceae bacterium]
MLKPLEQFVCDTCRQVIETSADGWFEWCEDGDRQAHSFHIVHQRAECRADPQVPGLRGHRLDELVGVPNMTRLYGLFDVGLPEEGAVKTLATLLDRHEFTDLLHRLTSRYYDEARQYWQQAKDSGFFEGSSEPAIYQPSTFKRIIEVYGAGQDGDGPAFSPGPCNVAGCCDHH